MEFVTNRGDMARMTRKDMNRIFGNINTLTGASLKTSYTQNYYVTASEWTAMITALSSLNKATGLNAILPTALQTATNINAIEQLTSDLNDRVNLLLRQRKANRYCGEIYAAEDYSRGL